MAGLFDGTPLERPVLCDRCGREVKACKCPAVVPERAATPPAEQSPRVRRERRRGKWTTAVAGLADEPTELKALLKQLQAAASCGGGLSDGELVLQGDHRDAVVARLIELGYRAKASGG